MEQTKRQLSEAVLVSLKDCGERKLNLESFIVKIGIDFGKRLTLILFE